jgi:uncharacterized protein YlaI
MVIYKYFSFENAVYTLLNHTILASHFDEYNDPFEASISWAKKSRSDLDKSDDDAREIDNDSGDDIVFSELTEERKTQYRNERDKVRSTCFSRTNKDILLWSHYANYHKGIALCFWSNEMLGVKNDKRFKNIEYNGEKVRIFKSTKPATFDKKVQKSFITKAKIWSYEEEVRLLVDINTINCIPFDQCENKCFIKFAPKSIHSIYYGCKSFGENVSLEQRVARELLQRYLKLSNNASISAGLREKPISEYNCFQSKPDYAIKIERVNSDFNQPFATNIEIENFLANLDPRSYLSLLANKIREMNSEPLQNLLNTEA